ncbi:MAG: UDP-N-acetylmuramoyl-L-alanine--D-glutamate ligase [Syntrophales bacterium]|nr:UDP-N-acetylmuramoyl-L-alanine--D-glutamate ligase [Syntrophales bacterium]
MDLNGKRVLVVGLGKTGVATVRFLTEKGAVVFASDEKPASELVDATSALGDLNVNMQLGEHRLDVMSQTDMVVPSPGVPPFNVMLLEAAKRGIPVLSEIELAWRFLKRPMIAITGTNGKTTTTTLLGEMLKKAGKEVFVGGNIGNPLIDYVNGKQEDDYVVVEVSSFQLQWVELFKPLISILLNTTYDHLDYHGTFEEYCSIKERIFKNQNGGDLAILNADDPLSPSLLKRIRAEITCFSSSGKLTEGIFLNGKVLRFGDENYPLEMMRLPGVHNIENVMAALVAARRCGCHPSNIISAVEDFKGIPHRIESVGQKGGVEFYDDSKATNVGAVVRALETFSNPIILLLGGRNKGGDFSVLAGPIREKVKQLVLFGEAGEEINSIIGGTVPTRRVLSFKDAVRFACNCSSSGDIVLLSPGCASFDEFANYKERGRYFKTLVRNF